METAVWGGRWWECVWTGGWNIQQWSSPDPRLGCQAAHVCPEVGLSPRQAWLESLQFTRETWWFPSILMGYEGIHSPLAILWPMYPQCRDTKLGSGLQSLPCYCRHNHRSRKGWIVNHTCPPTPHTHPYHVHTHTHTHFSSVQSLSRVWLFATSWTAAHQASLFITNSQSLLKLMSIGSVMPSNHLILCCPLFLLPSIFPSIRVFSNESVLHIRWPKYWSFNFGISPSNEYSGLISFRLTSLISLQSKGLSRGFSNTTVQKHKFFGTQHSL